MDGQTLDDDQDYLRELRLAWTLANPPGAVSPTIDAGQVLNMGLAAGAHVTLGPSAGLGRLVPGAPADLVLLDWDAVCMPWVSPRTPVADTLLRRAGRRHVRHVMVNGQWALRDGESTHVDERAVAAQIRAALDAQPADALAARARAADALAPYLRRFYAAWEDVSAPRDWGRGR
jgi:cytosine/adenosine deaminase-related metal-dependent hydrolase